MATFNFKYGESIGELLSSPRLVNTRMPLDVRSVVSSYEDLINPSTWTIKDGRRTLRVAYLGLMVSVNNISTNDLYMCLNENPSTADSWQKIGSEITWEEDLFDLNDEISNEEPNNEEPNNEEPSDNEPINNDSPEEP